MHFIANIREQLGISQQYLALLIGVSRAALGMAEAGTRHLPAPALEKILHMQQMLPFSEVEEKKEKSKQRVPATLELQLDMLITWCETKGEYYTQLAADIVTMHQQASKCLSVLPAIFNYTEIGDTGNEKRELVLKIIYRTCQQQLQRYPLSLARKCAYLGAQLEAMAKGAEPAT